jgi:hypothetical protein
MASLFHARVFASFVLVGIVGGGMALAFGCGGANSTGFFAPACSDGGFCSESEAQDPSPTADPHDAVQQGTDATPPPIDATGPASDGATFGPCRRDVECSSSTGLCNWALELCAVPAANGGKCRRDQECASKLCNWELEQCSSLGALDTPCRRDQECANKLCNWELAVCSNKLAKGGKCRRDQECLSGLCNQATDSCQ